MYDPMRSKESNSMARIKTCSNDFECEEADPSFGCIKSFGTSRNAEVLPRSDGPTAAM